jgi:hypothetical protein
MNEQELLQPQPEKLRVFIVHECLPQNFAGANSGEKDGWIVEAPAEQA